MSRSLLIASLVVLTARAVGAQVFTLPPRIAQQPRNETTQTLVFSSSFMGGYDQNQVPPNSPQGDDVNFRQSSYTGSADATLTFSRANERRSLNVSGHGNATRYGDVGGESGPVVGANVTANFQTRFGAKTSVLVSHTTSRTPFMSMGLFTNPLSAPSIAYDADGNPLNGLINGYLLSTASSAGLTQSLTRRTSAGLRYTYHTSRHEGSDVLENENHSAALDVSQRITRNMDVRTSYRVAVRAAGQTGLQYDDLQHSFNVLFSLLQPLTRTRALNIAVGGGADMIDVDTTADRYWRPTYLARIGTDIARSWTASASYTQTQNLLLSPLSAPDSYSTHSAVVSAGGNLIGPTSLLLQGGLTRGEVPASRSITGTSGEFVAMTAGAQLLFPLVRSLSGVISANYFTSELSGAAGLGSPTGTYRRNSVRAGLRWAMPLYDSSRGR
jgi:hypothetical protein